MFVLIAVHCVRSNLLQHHNAKLSIIIVSAFLIVQYSQPYINNNNNNIIIIMAGMAVFFRKALLGKLMHLLFGICM